MKKQKTQLNPSMTFPQILEEAIQNTITREDCEALQRSFTQSGALEEGKKARREFVEQVKKLMPPSALFNLNDKMLEAYAAQSQEEYNATMRLGNFAIFKDLLRVQFDRAVPQMDISMDSDKNLQNIPPIPESILALYGKHKKIMFEDKLQYDNTFQSDIKECPEAERESLLEKRINQNIASSLNFVLLSSRIMEDSVEAELPKAGFISQKLTTSDQTLEKRNILNQAEQAAEKMQKSPDFFKADDRIFSERILEQQSAASNKEAKADTAKHGFAERLTAFKQRIKKIFTRAQSEDGLGKKQVSESKLRKSQTFPTTDTPPLTDKSLENLNINQQTTPLSNLPKSQTLQAIHNPPKHTAASYHASKAKHPKSFIQREENKAQAQLKEKFSLKI